MRPDRDELLQHVREQVGFLRKRGAAFDEGDVAEAKQIAAAIRVLVHDGSGKSLLRQLRVKDSLRFVDSSAKHPPGAIVMISAGLGILRVNGDTGETDFAAPLGDRPERPRLRFRAWWGQTVLTDQGGNGFNRRDLVLGLAHKEGGAHVDLGMDRAYERLARSNSLGLQFGRGDELITAGSPVPVNVRQIGWELQTTIEEQIDRLLST